MSVSDRPRITLNRLATMKQQGERIAMMTAYDACFTRILADAQMDVVLVGDSLGMVIQGQDSTLPVSIGEMIYHSHCVSRAIADMLLLVDLPFASYSSPAQALGNAARLMREGGAHMVKLEGGQWLVETIALLTGHGIPCCGHLGLTPQSVHQLGGYRVQGRGPEAAEALLADAVALDQAGIGLLVLECVPTELAARVTATISVPVIGIGAGADCDGQVLVMHDALGLNPRMPRFCDNFLTGQDSIAAAISAYVAAVRAGRFPGPEHSFD